MKFPMFKVHINKKDCISELEKVITSGYLNEGEQVKKLKNWISQFLKEDYVTLTNSCTNALTLALKLANVKPGDEVISTSMTCLATNTPINNLEATVVWADISKSTGCIDPNDVIKKINSKTKAVVCVNWAGIPCELEKLYEICNKNNIKLIQDAAHAFGANLNGQSVSKYAHYTCYSFQAIKHITTGDGGAIICKDKNDHNRCNKLKWFGLDRDATKDEKGEWKGQRWEVDVEEAGYKFHMNNIAAAIGISQIKHVPKIVNSHKCNGGLYRNFFNTIEGVNNLNIPLNSDPSYWVYTVVIKDHSIRDELIKRLNDLGINAGLVHIPNHNYTCFQKSKAKLPNVEYFNKHQISLPCGWWLSKIDIEHICNTFEKTMKELS